MIVPDGADDKKLPPPPSDSESSTISSVPPSEAGDLPPSYENSASAPPTAGASSSSGTGFPPPTTPLPPPTNFVHIHRPNGAIRETLAIDPALVLPAALRPEGAATHHVELESQNGSVRADVHLVRSDGRGAARSDKDAAHGASLRFFSQNGSVNVRLHNKEHYPVKVDAGSKNGSVTLFIPRDYTGALILHSKNGWITPSPALKAQMRIFSESGGTMRAYLGDPARADDEGASEVRAESDNGSVKLLWEGEVVPDSAVTALFKGIGGFFGARS